MLGSTLVICSVLLAAPPAPASAAPSPVASPAAPASSAGSADSQRPGLKTKVYALIEAGDWVQARALVAEWQQLSPDNADSYEALANIELNAARTGRLLLASGAPEEDGDFALSDPDAGTVVGHLGERSEWDPAGVDRAVAALQKAIALEPHRLCCRFGLAYMLQTVGRPKEQVQAILAMLSYARGRDRRLTWEGEPLPAPASKFIPESLQDYVGHYLEREDLETARAIAAALVEYFPRNPVGYNDLAVIHMERGEAAQALPLFEKAHGLDPKDPLVLVNLTELHAKAGRMRDACSCLRKLRALPTGPENLRAIQRREQELGCETPL